jgi:hypothetical protein
MSDFDSKLNQAIQRGQQTAAAKFAEQQAAVMSEEQLRRLHSKYRLTLSEHIEKSLTKLADHFPGFQAEAVMSDRGWGTAIARDDMSRGGSTFSRLEVTVRPFSTAPVIEVVSRGTIRNKEILQRSAYNPLAEAQPERMVEQIDLWILEYAELYAARG